MGGGRKKRRSSHATGRSGHFRIFQNPRNFLDMNTSRDWNATCTFIGI